MELIYDAAMEPRLWAPLFEQLEKTLRTPFCVLRVEDVANRSCSFVAERGFDASYLRSYQDHYVYRNPFMVGGSAALRSGVIQDDAMMVPERTLLTSEFYNDWMVPQGAKYGVNATIVVDQHVASLLTLIRSDSDDRFDRDDHALLRSLMPHLQQAVHIHQRVSALQLLVAAQQSALDSWPLGLIILTDDGRVLQMNRTAEEVVRRGDGLTTGPDGRLKAMHADDTARLGGAILGTLRRPRGKRAPASDVVTLRQRQSTNLLRLTVAPLSLHRTIFPDSRGATVIFISDPDLGTEPDQLLMRRLYGFTKKEARVAALLIGGADVKTVADRLGLSFHTVRTHVQHVLHKADCRKQTEFVRVALQGPLALRHR